jgi:hypothetical protein
MELRRCRSQNSPSVVKGSSCSAHSSGSYSVRTPAARARAPSSQSSLLAIVKSRSNPPSRWNVPRVIDRFAAVTASVSAGPPRACAS